MRVVMEADRLSLLQLLLQLLLWAAFDLSSASALVLDVTTGEEFVQAIKLFGQQGGELTIALDGTSAPISVANATWDVEDQREGFQSGTLTIHASIPGTKVILDTAMKSGLTPALDAVEVTWQDIIFINKCSRKVSWYPEDNLFVLASEYMFLMPRAWSVQSTQRKNSIVYIPRQELLGLINMLVLEGTTFPGLKDGWVKEILGPAPPSLAFIKAMDDHSVTFGSLLRSGSMNEEVVYRSTSNPEDPFDLKLPELGGRLMAHRLCANDGSHDGPLLTSAEVSEANYTFFPTWLVSSTPNLRSSLLDASERGMSVITVRRQSPPLIVIILQDVSITNQGKTLPSISFRSDLLIHGPLSAKIVTLDLAFLSGAMRLSTNARMFIEGLALTGLTSTAISSEPGLNTSLHLAAFFRPDSEMVHLSNVTLHVPKQDFIVLLSAAHRGSRWQSGATSTASIMKRISTFKPTLFDVTSLHLSEYIGWNVEGMDLTFRPITPLSNSDQLLDQDNSESEFDKVALGVGVGVGGGGGLLLIGAFWALAAELRQRRSRGVVGGVKDVEQELKEHPSCKGKSQGSSTSLHKGKHVLTVAPESLNKSEAELTGVKNDEDVIHMDGRSMPIQKIAADQVEVALDAPMGLHALVRQQAATLVKSDNSGLLKLECMLGKGAWGTVYKGTWKGLTVAVKMVLFSEYTGSANKLPEKARAIMEAAVSTSISHPNVVSTYHYDILPVFHGHGDANGLQVANSVDAAQDWKLFLVLEYCHCTLGSALQSDFLHVGSHPRWDMILRLLLGIAQGTLYLHDLQIIHGDLKPENILLKVDPNTEVGVVAKITDFGLAMSLGPTATHVSDFRSGTPFYCAPEVASRGRTTKASDVFSFGVVMCEVCSRTPPWAKQGNDYITNTRFPRFAPGTPPHFQELAMRCLDLDMHARPRFEDIVASLQDLMEDSMIMQVVM